MLAFLAAFDAGDRVAVVRPGYPAYRNLLHALDVEPVEIAVGPDTGFRLTTEALDAAVAARGPLAGLVLASPANPTGSMVSRDQFAAIASWCAANDVRLVSDEIYHGITYPTEGSAATGRGTCAWSLDRSSVTVSSFSKYWGMTGWRIGWALAARRPHRAPALEALRDRAARSSSPKAVERITPCRDEALATQSERVPAIGLRRPKV